MPFATSILICGSKELLSEWRRLSSPLKTDITMMMAPVMIETRNTEIIEMMLMKFFFRRESR